MRKLLLASAAILGATSGLAMAQGPANELQGTYVGPYGFGPSYGNFNSTSGSLQNEYGSAAAGGFSTMAFEGKGATTIPTPGNVVIRFNGKVDANIGYGTTSVSSYNTVVSGTSYSFKQNPIGIGSYMRLYPSFDGMAANGVRYGAQIELRENFQPSTNNATTTANSATASQSANSPSVNTSAQTVMVRRAFTYLASDQVGIVRLGQGDGVIGLFDPCTFSSQCWDAGEGVFQGAMFGDFYPTNGTGGGATNYPWLAQAGAEYGNNKIVYLTPQIFGFDFAVQYAPSQGNAFQGTSPEAAFNAAGSAASAQTALDGSILTTSGAMTNRWINQVAAGARYQHTFGAIDVKAYGVWMGAGHESGPTSFAKGSTNNLQPISLYQFGAAVTVAGLTGAVTYQGGQVDNQLALLPDGGAKMSATVAGLTYVNGPWTMGETLGLIDSQGSTALVGISQRHQFENAVGVNYRLAPGINLVLQYDYYFTHQGNFNFLSNAAGTVAAPNLAHNNAQGQGLFFTSMLTW